MVLQHTSYTSIILVPLESQTPKMDGSPFHDMHEPFVKGRYHGKRKFLKPHIHISRPTVFARYIAMTKDIMKGYRQLEKGLGIEGLSDKHNPSPNPLYRKM
jgi:hypothetical protein